MQGISPGSPEPGTRLYRYLVKSLALFAVHLARIAARVELRVATCGTFSSKTLGARTACWYELRNWTASTGRYRRSALYASTPPAEAYFEYRSPTVSATGCRGDLRATESTPRYRSVFSSLASMSGTPL